SAVRAGAVRGRCGRREHAEPAQRSLRKRAARRRGGSRLPDPPVRAHHHGSPAVRRAAVALALITSCADARSQLEELASKGAPCQDASDCCVVADDCGAKAYVVGTADYAHARELEAEVEKEPTCAGCEPPFVEVICLQGTCTGVAFRPDRL